MTIKKLLSEGAEKLKQVNVERAFSEARLLLAEVLKCAPEHLIANDKKKVSEEAERKFLRLVERRLKFEPIAYLLGQKEFYSLPFRVTPNVLIPRPETEDLVSEIIEWVKHKDLKKGSIIDLGAGSGCIAITLAKHLKEFAVTAMERSRDALEVAQENADLNEVTIEWSYGDLRLNYAGSWDIIVSNPPYVSEEDMKKLPPDVKNFEPAQALNAGEDGLEFLSSIVECWLPHLKSGGLLALETSGSNHVQELSALIQSQNKGKLWSKGPHLFFEKG